VENKLILAAANIVAQPHPIGIYKDLFTDVFRKRRTVSYIGSDKIVPGKINFQDNSAWGYFIVYTEFEFEGDWVDLDTLDKAADHQINGISIPNNLRPNLRICYFYVDFKSHKIAFEHINEQGNKFSITGIQRALRKWLGSSQKGITVDVTVIPVHDSLTQILSIKHLSKLTIKVSIPNPDGVDGPYARIVGELKEQNAKSIVVVLEKQPRKDSLKPDKETLDLADAGMENGYVKGQGRDESGAVSYNSKDHPRMDLVTRRGLIQVTLAEWLQKVIGKQNGN
jgi:Domain of unknown function (DUF4747)